MNNHDNERFFFRAGGSKWSSKLHTVLLLFNRLALEKKNATLALKKLREKLNKKTEFTASMVGIVSIFEMFTQFPAIYSDD